MIDASLQSSLEGSQLKHTLYSMKQWGDSSQLRAEKPGEKLVRKLKSLGENSPGSNSLKKRESGLWVKSSETWEGKTDFYTALASA